MAFRYSPNIVTDGLVFAVDAANKKSYPGSGTTWKDLSKNGNDGTLTNGPTFDSGNGGSIVFDGSDDYVDFGNFSTTYDSITVTAWVKIDTNINYQHIVDSSNNSFHLATFQSSGRAYFYDGSTYHTNGPVLELNKWNYLTGISHSNYNYIYINGILGSTLNTTTNIVVNNVNIGRWQNGGNRYINGNIAQAKIYNRALTAQEVTQNYNALKSRFEL